MLVKTFSASVQGLQASTVTIEVNATRGTRFVLVGLPDSTVKESYERIVAAIENSGYTFPTREIIINLAPADVRKEGSGFDLPMAIGILALGGEVDTRLLNRYMMVGELSLDGSLQPVKGALPISIKAREMGFEGLFVPEENVREAAVVNNLKVYGVRHINQVIGHLNGQEPMQPTVVDTRAEFFAKQSEFVRKPEKNAELKALYVTGDPEIIELKNTLESLGFIFDFSKGQANYKVVCCSTVYKIFSNTRASEFIKLMSLIKECWHGDKESLRKEIISGLWIFLSTYVGEININLAASKLSKISPVEIIRDGKTHREMPGDTKYAWIIATAYNKGNRSNKVDVSKLTMKTP